MNLGRVSSAALMLSGLAGVLVPEKVLASLDLRAGSGRGIAETRAGLGGTYAAIGTWAMLSRRSAAHTAVGVLWLGAAVARLTALVIDEPETDAAYWAYLAAEIGFGCTALASAHSGPRARRVVVALTGRAGGSGPVEGLGAEAPSPQVRATLFTT